MFDMIIDDFSKFDCFPNVQNIGMSGHVSRATSHMHNMRMKLDEVLVVLKFYFMFKRESI